MRIASHIRQAEIAPRSAGSHAQNMPGERRQRRAALHGKYQTAPVSGSSPMPPLRRPQGGLTLIELLASFAILAMIVTLLGVALNTASDIWHSARTRTRVVAQARAVMDTMAQDIRQAVADTNFPVTISTTLNIYGATTNSSILFCKLLGHPATNQYAVEAVGYDIVTNQNTFSLCRQSQDITAAGLSPENLSPAGSRTNLLTLADGLAALSFGAPASFTHAPPYIDIYVELLSDDDCRTVAGISDDTRQRHFVELHSLRFVQRVFLPAATKWNLP